MEQKPLTFNDFNMQTDNTTDGIITSAIRDMDMPDVQMDKDKLNARDGEKWLSSNFGKKTIQVEGKIISVSASGLEGRVDEFKRCLYPKAVGLLRTTKAGQLREYEALVSSVAISQEAYETTMVPFIVRFEVPAGFGYRPDIVCATTFSGVTSSSFIANVLTSGNAPYLPVIKVKINSATQLGRLTLENLATQDKMTFARAFSAGEQVELDLDGDLPNILGSGITYSGLWINFIAYSGINPLKITTASGTQNYDVSVAYKPRYL